MTVAADADVRIAEFPACSRTMRSARVARIACQLLITAARVSTGARKPTEIDANPVTPQKLFHKDSDWQVTANERNGEARPPERGSKP